jgi:hypothetical protein
VPLHDETGNIAKWYGTAVDIEDRKRAESLIAVEKRMLEMVAKGDSLRLNRLVELQSKTMVTAEEHEEIGSISGQFKRYVYNLASQKAQD